jgi:putative redox protein
MPFERTARLEWSGTGMQFTGAGVEPPSPAVTLDGDGNAGPGPMQTLLLAAACCTGSDVVLILEKMRVQLRTFTIDVVGIRRDELPQRYIAIRFHFRLSGGGLDAAKAEHAVSLSLEKYCSVVHSLAPDIAITREIEVT